MNINAMSFDVVIVGAGIAGAALACALGNSSLRIALVETKTLSSQWPEQQDTLDGFDARVSALTLASQRFLNELGVWSDIEQRRISAYQKMHVWDAQGIGSIDFIAQEINQPALGYIVENRLTVAALLTYCQRLSNVQLIDSALVSSISANKQSSTIQQQLQLEDGRCLFSSLIVAADGANSGIREQAHFAMREWDYGHHALVATVRTANSHQHTAWQRFMPEGPLAFLPLQTKNTDKHFCSIVWSTVASYNSKLMALDDQEFIDALGCAFEFTLGKVLAVSQRLSFALRQRHAVDYVKPGIALVGDAAHTIHPLAGQGINLGLMDVKILAQEILRAQQRQLNVGDIQILHRFQRQRKGNNLAMMAAMEGFKRLFEPSALPICWARNTGMSWLNNNKLLKHRLMREAIGL